MFLFVVVGEIVRVGEIVVRVGEIVVTRGCANVNYTLWPAWGRLGAPGLWEEPAGSA